MIFGEDDRVISWLNVIIPINDKVVTAQIVWMVAKTVACKCIGVSVTTFPVALAEIMDKIPATIFLTFLRK
jgi:hypothetical protein